MDLVISQGEAKHKRPGRFEPKASFQAAAERALETPQIHAHAGSNTGDVYKKLQRLVSGAVSGNADACQDNGGAQCARGAQVLAIEQKPDGDAADRLKQGGN